MDLLLSLNNLEKCRVCLEKRSDSTYLCNINAFESEAEEHSIRQKVLKYLPDLELTVTQNAAICINCLSMVNLILEIKNVCLQTEEEVQSYVQEIGSSHINLTNSIQEDVSVKQDPDEIDIKDEPLNESVCSYTSNLIKNEQNEEDSEVTQSKNEKELCEVESVAKAQSVSLRTRKRIDYNEKKFYNKSQLCKRSARSSHREDTLIQQAPTCSREYKCKMCHYKSCRESNLVQHMQTHGGEKPFKCMECSRKFSTSRSLKRHLQIHTGEKPYTCKLCNYKSVRNSYLVLHMQTHTGEKPVQCSVCSKKFANKDYLTKHVRIHTAERPHKCNLCNYKAARKSTLATHMLTHTGEKPFKCSVCLKKFSRKGELKQHLRIHTGERPYQCNLCDYKAAQMSALIPHTQTHTGEKPFQCSECSKKFATSGTMRRHMNIHTRESPDK